MYIFQIFSEMWSIIVSILSVKYMYKTNQNKWKLFVPIYNVKWAKVYLVL